MKLALPLTCIFFLLHSMLPWDASGSGMGKPFPLPDAVTILEPKEEAPVNAPVSESRQVAATIGGAAPNGQQDVPSQAENPSATY
jgi:small subunit ribosomal protein S3e